MDRGLRRSAERRLKKLIAKDGDNCTACRTAFAHNVKTYYGVLKNGDVAITGDCCATRLEHVLNAGIYVDRHYDAFSSPPGGTERRPQTQAELARNVDSLQSYVAGVDQFGDELSRTAGMPQGRPIVSLENTSWKADDAAWFQANPGRSHRFRPMHDGEEATFPPAYTNRQLLPPQHEMQMLVRQIEPGKRIRIPFGRNLEIPIPDIEEIVHALFDVVAKSPGGVIPLGEVRALAQMYGGAQES